ncbi:hypothetical protein CVT26_007193, partial [Gymnopilus dilepis]
IEYEESDWRTYAKKQESKILAIVDAQRGDDRDDRMRKPIQALLHEQNGRIFLGPGCQGKARMKFLETPTFLFKRCPPSKLSSMLKNLDEPPVKRYSCRTTKAKAQKSSKEDPERQTSLAVEPRNGQKKSCNCVTETFAKMLLSRHCGLAFDGR